MIWILILCILLIGGLSYLLYINSRKVDKLELFCEAYVSFISAMYFRVKDVQDRLQEVDRLGAFKADDEVGFVFTEINSAVEDLHAFITKYVNAGNQTKEDQEEEQGR